MSATQADRRIFPTQPDPQETLLTRQFIEKRIRQATGGDAYVIDDLVNNLILREVHEERVRDLRDALRVGTRSRMTGEGQQVTPPVTPTPSSSSTGSRASGAHPATSARPRSSTGTGTGTGNTSPADASPSPTSPSPKWDVPTQVEELRFLLSQKDKIMEKKDDDYRKLKKILSDTQNDLQSVLDLNSHYLEIIAQFTKVQQSNNATQRDGLSEADEARDLETELAESEQCIADLQGELAEIAEELEHRETELESVLHRENHYKDILGLKPAATSRDVEKRIKKIVDDGTMQKREIDKVKRELRKVMHTRAALEEKISTLSRQKETMDFHKRQQELTMKKMTRLKQKAPVTHSAKRALQPALSTQQMAPPDPPSGGTPGVHLRLPQTLSYHRLPQYCMVCREMFTPLKAGEGCRTHFKRYKGGAWTCCGENRVGGGGCLKLPHLYIELTVDKKTFITDGANYLQL